MKKDSIFIGATFFSALLAALCCLGPLLFIALGLGISGFSFFWTYRPLFIVITIIFLLFAFYYTYKKRPIVCEDGSCKIMGGSRRAKIIVWVVAILAIALMLLPYWLPGLLNVWGS